MIGEHPCVKWAIEVIENYVRNRIIVEPHSDLPEALFKTKAGAFVTIHKKDGSLRGCIGTFMPVRENLAYEIRDNAIAAATKDPRFPPVEAGELEDLVVNVDVLSPYEDVKSMEELDPKKYGIIVQKGWRRGLLLPNIESIDTVEEQLRIAKLKAGIYDDDFEIFKFTVERYR